jgi:hypothetical protein
VGFVVDKAALGQVFSEYLGFPCNHSTNFFITIVTRGWHNRPLVAAVPSGPNWTPPPLYKLKKKLAEILGSCKIKAKENKEDGIIIKLISS